MLIVHAVLTLPYFPKTSHKGKLARHGTHSKTVEDSVILSVNALATQDLRLHSHRVNTVLRKNYGLSLRLHIARFSHGWYIINVK